MLQDSYTIMPKIVIDKNPLLNIKKNLKPGNIIVFVVNKELDKQIEAVLNYIISKGYSIKTLEEGLKE